MSNVNLPTPILVTAAAGCLLAGYLLGVVVGPHADRTTGVVESYDLEEGTLCLSGSAVADLDGAEAGTLCGTWRRSPESEMPQVGDKFLFVSVRTPEAPAGEDSDAGGDVMIFGSVVE